MTSENKLGNNSTEKKQSADVYHAKSKQRQWTKSFLAIPILILFIAFCYQSYISSFRPIEKRLVDTLNSLLAIERDGQVNVNAKIAIGYGACLDYVVPSRCLILNHHKPPVNPFHHVSVDDKDELLEVFAYYFNHGAAAERYINNQSLFKELVSISETCDILKSIGGNAPIMASRLAKEGIKNILLGAHMSPQLSKYLTSSITIAGPSTETDDVHLLIEYPTGENWLDLYSSPRANRFIVHNDDNNPLLKSLEIFHRQMNNFQPDLFVIGGLQMMEGYPGNSEKKRSRLEKVSSYIKENFKHRGDNKQTKLHFEMASYSDETILRDIIQLILPHVDSLGMNEQELPNLYQMLTFGNLTLVSDPYPRVATVLDQMRDIYEAMFSFTNGRISRIHVHTLAFQAILVHANSDWKNSAAAAAKAALTSHRHTCGSDEIDSAKARLIMDESFSTTRSSKQNIQRIVFNSNVPVACWSETLDNKQKIQFCVAPVLVCTNVLQTGGGGDNVSAAGLVLQI
ncbi:ADP-dependent glucokinase-like [Panonychus citri]|uniref:ADP-dependent glucokinase-like n=1 Tax=Panonychus citri TaxID=50023 RepID=UPI002307B6A2|nr:ADP-dependent glucokinase-like [Panonychus citri]XP_053203576.1 ADP-dependent glucokinase-like [Panonychus citri]XP_053204058.1 ADP-dependent glucokinase-like [Panonychus citri]